MKDHNQIVKKLLDELKSYERLADVTIVDDVSLSKTDMDNLKIYVNNLEAYSKKVEQDYEITNKKHYLAHNFFKQFGGNGHSLETGFSIFQCSIISLIYFDFPNVFYNNIGAPLPHSLPLFASNFIFPISVGIISGLGLFKKIYKLEKNAFNYINDTLGDDAIELDKLKDELENNDKELILKDQYVIRKLLETKKQELLSSSGDRDDNKDVKDYSLAKQEIQYYFDEIEQTDEKHDSLDKIGFVRKRK